MIATKLTPTEKRLLIMLADTAGSDQEVADASGLSKGTVKVYLNRIRGKLGRVELDVKSRYRLITFAKDHRAELEN